jgi:hypothetical protein
MARERRSRPRSRAIIWETVRDLALALPQAEEGTSYGTPAIKVRGKLFVRRREEGDVIVVRIDEKDRAMRMQADPNAFFITDHYAAYPYMLVRLSAVSKDDLGELLRDAWRLVAPQKLVAEWDGA